MRNKGRKSSLALMRKRTSRPTQQAEKRAFKDFSRQLIGHWMADDETILLQMTRCQNRVRW